MREQRSRASVENASSATSARAPHAAELRELLVERHTRQQRVEIHPWILTRCQNGACQLFSGSGRRRDPTRRHWRPIFLGFKRGGKIVATTGGALLGFAPIVGGIGAGIWLLVFFTTRYVSLASMIAGLAMPAVAAALGYPWPVIAFCGAAAAGIVFLHRANISRLLHRQEPRAALPWSKSRAAPSSGRAA